MTRSYLAAAAALALSTTAGAQERDLRGALAFEGRFLVSISDADMVASAYVDG